MSLQVPAIEVKGLKHQFGKHLALDGMEFSVASGSLHGFVGPNGAGKTTTLKIICTLLRPQQGSAQVFGRDVVKHDIEVRSQIGFMPDHFSMYRQMSVFEYLDFFGAAYGLRQKDRDSVIGDVLALTDMDGRRHDLIQGLSRGMQQRVGLARVLINDPKLLLLDEPASGLDPRARLEMMEILRELRRMGKTIFISSHILSELGELCDSVTVVDRGAARFSGPIDDLLRSTHEGPAWQIRFDKNPPELRGTLATLAGVARVEPLEATEDDGGFRVVLDPSQEDGNAFLRQVLDARLSVVSFARDRKRLNQAFMELTTKGVRT